MACTANAILKTMRGWLGYSEANGKHKQIIDIYNSHKPLARGYKVKYTDSWCDTCVSAAAIVNNATDIIGTECGCEQHVKIFKKLGIWIEDGKITPKAGDIIVYNWDKKSQPNDGYSDHIGFVEKVENNMIHALEGNRNNMVSIRLITVGSGYIRGFARPNYIKPAVPAPNPTPNPVPNKKNITTIANEVISGKWGTGADRKKRLEAAGYNYNEVQNLVNKMFNTGIVKDWARIERVAREVIKGKYGNGAKRRKNIEALGLNYADVQAMVNKILKD